MILVVGGAFSGKRDYVLAHLGYSPDDLADGVLDDRPVLYNLHKIVLASPGDAPGLLPALLQKAVVVCDEVGAGVVPIDRAEREGREAVGRLCIELAKRADRVIRLVCGIPQVIKADRQLALTILRHGQTAGNLRHAYVGSTDDPLCDAGRDAIRRAGPFPHVPLVYASPLCRARETAEILFPNARIVLCPGLQEMDFGVFEGRNAEDMRDDPVYTAWVDSGCRDRCPGGEAMDDFRQRTQTEFERIAAECLARGDESLVIVAHGGTIMSVMSRFSHPPRPYFDWRSENGGGYTATVLLENGRLHIKNYTEVATYGK